MGLLNNEQIQSLKKDQNTSIKDLPALAFENHLINEAQWGEVVGLCLNSPHFLRVMPRRSRDQQFIVPYL